LLVHRLKRHRLDPARDGDQLVLGGTGGSGESFIPKSLILPEGILALCDDAGLRSVNLATLPTLNEHGVVVRQTGGRDPHRGIQISDAPVGGPQTAGAAPSALAGASHVPAVAPRPLDKGKGPVSSSSAPGIAGMLEEERRRRLRHADRSFVSDPPPPLGPRRPAPKSIRGTLAGLRSPAPRPRAHQSPATTTIGSTATTTTTTVGLAAANSTWGWSPPGVPAATTTTAATAVAPLLGSLEGPGPQVSGAPFFLIGLFNMPTGLNPSFAC
jgi:hypothetical protein